MARIAFVTLPTVFQMWFGRPQIETEVHHQEWSNQKRFICEISNASVDNGFLRAIGVSRDDVTISAGYEIHESGTQKIVINQTRGILYSLSDVQTKGLRIRVDDAFPVAFVCMTYKNGKLFAVLDSSKEMELPHGRYVVNIIVSTKDRDFEFKHEVISGHNIDNTIWAS